MVILKRITYIILIWGVANIMFLFFQQINGISSEEIDSTIANSNEITIGNNILVAKQNNILTFPYVFGERLYLYNTKKDQWKLIRNYKIPFSGFGNELAVDGDSVYYNDFLMEEGNTIYSRKISGFHFEKKVADWASIYTISYPYMYYLHDTEGYDEEDNNLYRKNLKTGKTEMFLKGQFSYVLRQDEKYIYTYDSKTKEVLQISQDKKHITRCNGIEHPIWIGYTNEEQFIIVNESNIVLYDKKKNKSEYYIKNLKKEKELINEQIRIIKNTLYYSNQKLDCYSLNLKTGKITSVFSVSDIEEFKETLEKGDNIAQIHYCDNYIVVDITYSGYKKRKLLIYDYNEKQLKSIKLSVLNV